MNKNQIKEEMSLLAATMRREVSIMRELLSSLKAEQKALLEGRAQDVRNIIGRRESLVQMMVEARDRRVENIKNLAGEQSIDFDEEMLKDKGWFAKFVASDMANELDLLLLRDQMVELAKQVKNYQLQNNNLLQNKIAFTRGVMNSLQPREKNPTYNLKGAYQEKPRTATLTLINQEV